MHRDTSNLESWEWAQMPLGRKFTEAVSNWDAESKSLPFLLSLPFLPFYIPKWCEQRGGADKENLPSLAEAWWHSALP